MPRRPDHPDHPPETLPDQVADAAMKAAEDFAEANGVAINQLYLTLTLKGLPEGVENATAAGSGFEDTRDLLSFQLAHIKAVAKAADMDVRFVFPEMN